MEPEGSLPHSQLPATCPYPEPVRSSSYSEIPLPEDTSYYYPPIYAYVLQVTVHHVCNNFHMTLKFIALNFLKKNQRFD